MGWLDFFKIKNETSEESRSVNLSEAYVLINKELEKEENTINEIKKKVENRVNEFISDLNIQINNLVLIDISEKREDEKLKRLTMQGLEEYIEQLRRLIIDLEKTDSKEKISIYFKGINRAVNIFIKDSQSKYQRATILIGKELAEVKERVKLFYKKFDEIVKESGKNSLKVDEIKRLSSLKESLNKTELIKQEMNNTILSLKKRRTEAELEKKEIERDMELFKESKEFKEWVKKKEDIEKGGDILNKNIFRIKDKINLKSLLKQFHGIEDEEKLIQEYRDNFLNALKEDSELEIINILTTEDKESIKDELKSIKEKQLNLEKENIVFRLNEKLDSKTEELNKINYELEEIPKKIEDETRKIERFNEKEKDTKKEIIKLVYEIIRVRVI